MDERWYELWGKRAFDVAAALALLLATAPLFLLLALAVRLRLGAPVFFVQLRAGRGGRPFPLWKFRSMREAPGSDADRLDGFGRALRRSGLDELPQLLKVIRVQMRIVGQCPMSM